VDTLADRLSQTRQAKGWSARELARRAGVSVMAVTTTEQGKHEPSLKVLRRLATALEISPAWLAFGNEGESLGNSG
jgi:transcriptional regulator with XRE-family HTH domain